MGYPGDCSILVEQGYIGRPGAVGESLDGYDVGDIRPGVGLLDAYIGKTGACGIAESGLGSQVISAGAAAITKPVLPILVDNESVLALVDKTQFRFLDLSQGLQSIVVIGKPIQKGGQAILTSQLCGRPACLVQGR